MLEVLPSTMKKNPIIRKFQRRGVPGGYQFVMLVQKTAEELNLPPREVYKLVCYYFRKVNEIVTMAKGDVVIRHIGKLKPSNKAYNLRAQFNKTKKKRSNKRAQVTNKKKFKNKRNRLVWSEEYISLLNIDYETSKKIRTT